MGKSMENFTEQKNTLGLYDPQFEHDACGIGAVVDIKGRKSHQTATIMITGSVHRKVL